MPQQQVFLSYCHENGAEAKVLQKELQDYGFDVRWDKKILPGQDWKFEIRRAMKRCCAVVICLSKEGEAKTRAGIYPEALDAIAIYREHSPGKIFLIPVRFSECEIPPVEIDSTRTLDRLQHVDLFPPDERNLKLLRLLASLREACPTSQESKLVTGQSTGELPHEDVGGRDKEPSTTKIIIEFVIDGNVDEFRQEGQIQLLHAIAEIIEINNIRNLEYSIRSGSVKLTIKLSPTQAVKLLHAFQSGGFEEYHVVDTRIIRIIEGDKPVEDKDKKHLQDQHIIQQIEHLIDTKLKPKALEHLSLYDLEYALDDEGRVVGLSLPSQGLGDIELMAKLRNLQTLSLNNNEIKDVSPLAGLRNLQTLSLNNNEIKDVSPLAGLRNLQTLFLNNNEIEILPRAVLTGSLAIKWDWDFERGIYLEGNPLKFPPAEIVQSGEAALASYRASVERGAVRPMNEVKVLLVGEGGSGKTSLVKRLVGEDFDPNESQTHGINIRRVNMAQPTPGKDPIHVRFWDFGGQEIMHATHQFFLSKRSVYGVVLDARKQDAAEYWLKHVESFGGASPVLVVVNKVDENPGFRVPRKQLQAKYPGIRGFFRISCARPQQEDGIKAVRAALTEALVQTPLFGSVWSEDWFNVKTALEEMEQPYIDYETYQGTCQKLSIEETQTQETLVDFLHDLGVVLHFHKFDLGDTHVLDPKWVTQAVYKIINAPLLAERHGLLRKSALRSILARKTEADYLYPRDKHRYIIETMKEFELCYAVDADTILVPDLLDVQEPDFDFDFDDALACILQYDFLPRSVMPRFIVKTHKAIKSALRWRTGVVLEDDDFDCTAVVRSDQEDRRIFLYVAGVQKRDYFAAILHILRSINDDFEKIVCQVRLPLPDNPNITVSYEHLVTLEGKGVRYFIPEDAETAYNVQELLGRIPASERLEEEIIKQLLELEGQLITDRESFLSEANRIVDVKPNFFGLAVNFNALADRFFDRKRKQIGEE